MFHVTLLSALDSTVEPRYTNSYCNCNCNSSCSVIEQQ